MRTPRHRQASLPGVLLAFLALAALAATPLLQAAAQGPPSSATIRLQDARFAEAIPGAAAAWDGQHAYIFGGNASDPSGQDIHRYDPVTDTLQLMSAKLPVPLAEAGAFWDGIHVYVLGGYTTATYACGGYDLLKYLVELALYTAGLGPPPSPGGTGTCVEAYCRDSVYQYDPATDTLATLALRLPAPACGDVVWDGAVAHFFPSHVPPSGPLVPWATATTSATGPGGFVMRFDPTAGTMQLTAARMLSSWGSPVLTNNGTYYLGGQPQISPTLVGGITGGTANLPTAATIYHFDPVNQTLLPLDNVTLPADSSHSGVIWDGALVYLLGGWKGPGSPMGRSDILTFDPVTRDTDTYALALPHDSAFMATVSTGMDGFAFGGNLSADDRVYCLHCQPWFPVFPPPPPPPIPPPPTTPQPPILPPTPSPPTPPSRPGNQDIVTQVGHLSVAVLQPAPQVETFPPVAAINILRHTCAWNLLLDGSGSSDPDGTIVGWRWTFDDGTEALGPLLQQHYSGPASHGIQLTVTDDEGNTDTETIRIELRGCMPNEEETATDPSGMESDAQTSGDPALDQAPPVPLPAQAGPSDPRARPDTPLAPASGNGSHAVTGAPLWPLVAMALGILLLMMVAYRRSRDE